MADEMVEQCLAHYLEDYGLGVRAATTGWGIYYGQIPNEPDQVIVVRKYGGYPDEPNNDGTVRLEFPAVMVSVRGIREDYDSPMIMMQRVVKSVTKIGNQDLYGVNYKAVLVKTPAYHFDQDQNLRHQFNVNLQVFKDFSDPG